ncbi:MAG: PEP-CTERM sorting domain-containing protein [Thiobacillaceae bacterium]|jgi:hypothetical protein|nr:PEP-CTERM sorting domain-containing protein [Thiobacillaceae bacterium]
MFAKRPLALLIGTSALLLAGQAGAGPMQVLLDEDLQDVTGIAAATTVRTVADINTNNPSQLDGAPTTAFVNTGNGNASALSFNVRRWDNAIDGNSGSPTLGNNTFDNFFGGSPNQFLVMGDNSGNLGDNPNGGTNATASSTMAIRFALDPISLVDPRKLSVVFDYVFDANNTANPDDFIAELILADASTVNLVNIGAPTATTRGTYSNVLAFSGLADDPVFLNFRLLEGSNLGSSSIGLDNIKVTVIPEPGVLALLGLGLLGLGLARGRRA